MPRGEATGWITTRWNGRGELVCPLRGQSLESRLAAQRGVRRAFVPGPATSPEEAWGASVASSAAASRSNADVALASFVRASMGLVVGGRFNRPAHSRLPRQGHEGAYGYTQRVEVVALRCSSPICAKSLRAPIQCDPVSRVRIQPNALQEWQEEAYEQGLSRTGASCGVSCLRSCETW